MTKRTSATESNASAHRPGRRNNLVRRAALVSAGLVAGLLLFVAGRESAGLPAEAENELNALRLEILLQQGAVDRLRRDNEHSVDALAARLAELQASSTRLDALGGRLAQMAQLTLGEFDFDEPAPRGGPGDEELLSAHGVDELGRAIASLSDRLRSQSTQLDALQLLMLNRRLEQELTPAGWPVRKGWISSRYGERNDPFTGKRTRHSGLDFAGTRGTEVLSVASGVVIWAAARHGYGALVEIDHGNGYRTRYAHNEKLTVAAGDHVTAGQVIAHMGSSGRSSAPHVHFEVLKDGGRVNPASFVAQLR